MLKCETEGVDREHTCQCGVLKEEDYAHFQFYIFIMLLYSSPLESLCMIPSYKVIYLVLALCAAPLSILGQTRHCSSGLFKAAPP